MTDQVFRCVVSGKPIPPERVQALIILEVPPEQWCLKEYSNVKHKRGIYLGEHGTSELLLVKKVSNESVRDVFNSVERTDEPTLDDLRKGLHADEEND